MSHQHENESNPGEIVADEIDSDGYDEVRSDQDFRTKIFSVLQRIRKPSTVAYSAVDSSLPSPVLHLPPHGILGLPLSNDDAQKIISQASQSPFGRGEDTLIDTTVRKSWELNPNQFSLKNPAWNKAIETILDKVTTGLGLENGGRKVSAELYKLLLYEPGAFFKPHKDSEKAPGMFATLVVCLPSPHKGGKLVMTHDNEKYEFETASSSDFSFSYAAWYSDITHEVQPVVSGYRLMLTYNLIRQTDFEIPSYSLACRRVKRLSNFLQQYNLQLEKKDDKLPPVLLHKLEHKYTQASLKLNLLKPPDVGQVQMLAQLSTKLGFDIYLATLELEIRKDDHDDYEIERSKQLKNIVELDGKLVLERLYYPKGALIDPTPLDEDEADEEDHEGPTGNAGSPATYWYRDTVVVLVPPSKRLNFAFQFQSNGPVIDPLFCKLLQELSEDPAQRPKLEQMCELALKPTQRYNHLSQISASIPPYFQQAAAAALDLGRIDLFDEACKTTQNKIMLDNAHLLGHWAAQNGIVTMFDRLMKGVQSTSLVAKKIKFLKAIHESFEAFVPEERIAEVVSLKEWSDEVIFTSVAGLSVLTKDDGTALAKLCESMSWNQFESKTKPIILKALSVTRIAFSNQLMSTLQQELDEEQRTFIEMIIRTIWNEFVFDATYHKAMPQTSSAFSRLQSKNNVVVTIIHLNENDILNILQNTFTILSSECVETAIIPAMLKATPLASKKSAQELFLSLVQMILKNELPGFKLPADDAVPPHSHKRLVQALLIKFLLETVGHEPQAPRNWSLPARSCNCGDCWEVNRFLQDPVQQRFDFPCSKARRYHLHQNFTNCNQSTYDVTTIRDRNPNVWRITKHQRGYQALKSEWVKNFNSAVQTLSILKNDPTMNGRLETYLQPYYNIIMNANVKELPDLKSLVTMPQLFQNDENAGPSHNQLAIQIVHERRVSIVSLPEGLLIKRPKF